MSFPRPGSPRWTDAHAEGATAYALHVSEVLDARGVPPAPSTCPTVFEAVGHRLRSMPLRAEHPDGIVPLDPGAWCPVLFASADTSTDTDSAPAWSP